jgi:YtxH-like protein
LLDKQRLRTFLLGGAAGIVAGILLAPRSGKELRGSIANRAGEARERSRETYFEAQERMRERLAEAREASRPRPEDVDVGATPSREDDTPDTQPRRRRGGAPGGGGDRCRAIRGAPQEGAGDQGAPYRETR